MTEAEWNEAFDPSEMLEALRATTNAQNLWQYVTLCLYGIGADACVDLLQPHIAGEMDEREILANRNRLEAEARRRSGGGYIRGKLIRPSTITKSAQRARAAEAAFQQSPWSAAEQVTQVTRHLLQREQCKWLRCLFSNPKCPITMDPNWRTSDVVAMARGMYETRDFAAMPILADALQDAGCENADVLEHCRGPGPHVRGCWVVDLILGKE